MPASALDPRLALVRRWAVDWLSAGDPGVCEQILHPDYSISIGGHVLAGREAYVAGTMAQLERFPGLGLTVHELIWSGDGGRGRLAVRFTEHGAAARLDGRPAAWGGIVLFDCDGERLTWCWAEEDYLSRRRQLDGGAADPIDSPAASPWTTEPAAADPACETAVRAWLAAGDLDAVTLDDAWLDHPAPPLLADATVELDAMFSAGSRVAFHGRLSGAYRGGLDGVGAEAQDRPAAHHLAGIVTVREGAVVAGRVVRDRLGLARSLQDG